MAKRSQAIKDIFVNCTRKRELKVILIRLTKSLSNNIAYCDLRYESVCLLRFSILL